MNKFLNGLVDATNYTLTENGAVTHKTTKSDLMDMFALGGAYRNRSDSEVLTLFTNAFKENPVYALKCLFYLRDCRGGQGERRFFRVCIHWLAEHQSDAIIRNMEYVPDFGRWDDLLTFIGTPCEKTALNIIQAQLALDVQCKTPSLLAKWLPSENASSAQTCYYGNVIRKYLGMTHKQYRKTLSILRGRINVLERLMSANRWDEIEFDKIPSRAGFIYRNAFARRDIIKQKYETFAKDTTTKVNARTLYPYEVVHEILEQGYYHTYRWGGRNNFRVDDVGRAILNKYWDNLADYIKDAKFNGICVADTSGSMEGRPLEVAISLAMYCATKANGPYKNHFLTFNAQPELMRVEGADVVDQVLHLAEAPWGNNTNVEAVFDLLLVNAIRNHCTQDEIPENVIVISDMEFDNCVTTSSGGVRGNYNYHTHQYENSYKIETLFEAMATKWAAHGYQMPKLVFWNVDARQDNIPMKDNGRVSYVSGFSPVLYEQIMQGKTGYDLMMDKLNSERYACIQ